MDPYQPDLVALEGPEKVHKPVSLPDRSSAMTFTPSVVFQSWTTS
jgi:hypothetical protein